MHMPTCLSRISWIGRQLSETSELLCTCGGPERQLGVGASGCGSAPTWRHGTASQRGGGERVRLGSGCPPSTDSKMDCGAVYGAARAACGALTQGPQSEQSVPRSHRTSKMVMLSVWSLSGVGRPSLQTPFLACPGQESSQTVFTLALADAAADADADASGMLLPPLPPSPSATCT